MRKSEITRNNYNLKLPVITIIMLYISLYFNGVEFGALSGVKVTLIDICIGILLVCWLFYFLKNKFFLANQLMLITLILALIILVWIGIESLRSFQPMRSLTLNFIVIRNICVMLVVAYAILLQKEDMKRLNDSLFKYSVLISIASIVAYLIMISDQSRVLANPRPGLIYRAGEGNIPHLQGFTQNPIILGVLLIPPIITGLSLKVKGFKRNIIKYLGLSILILTLILTFSRGATILLILALFLFILANINNQGFKNTIIKYIGPIFIMIMIALPFAATFKLPNSDLTFLDRLIERFMFANFESRYDNYWHQIIPKFKESPLIGDGARATEILLNGQYAENSYLEILYDTGLVGLFTWLIFLLFIISCGIHFFIKKDINGVMFLPWLIGLIICAIGMFYISMQHNPVLWIFIGIVLGIVSRGAQKNNNSYSEIFIEERGK
ncbi:O-antigen ligase family protein [Bacillus paranthracis]|uniref:O-antigen ligase family protein n=1 Tax=Bacillus paranthracis TaxID=2026186 RepID=UPI00187AED88|nr:O-antigen ligase family protein [Bacillus paranthracis]MBE7145199.1 hypothetical protein [Bacillus paranthracis]